MPRSRSRSRSPYRSAHTHSRHHRTRSRSPRSHRSHHHHRHHHYPSSHHTSSTPHEPRSHSPAQLPLNARPLSKHDYDAYKNLFALYLDVQKQLYIEDLDERERKGRWKSFVGKWNRGELPEGWYDPLTLSKADRSQDSAGPRDSPPTRAEGEHSKAGADGSDDSDDDEIGPALPPGGALRAPGPAIPSRQDLEVRDELAQEDAANSLADLRYSRKLDRKAQKERLEELVPRSDPNSRERKMEKKADVAVAQRAYVDSKGGGDMEFADNDLMGDDGVDGYKKRKAEAERKKTEREIRKEEIMRARAAEREERLAEHRAKEEKNMEMFRAMARARFGGGAGNG